jgi:hypothetical protein
MEKMLNIAVKAGMRSYECNLKIPAWGREKGGGEKKRMPALEEC